MLKLSTKHKIAAAALLSKTICRIRGAFGLPPRGVFRRAGVRYELDLTEGIDLSLYLFGVFEAEVAAYLRGVLRQGDWAVDVGANLGSHTLPMARWVGPQGRILACEPTDYAFARLSRNLELNPDLADRVSARQVFLAGSADVSLPGEIPSSWPLQAGPEIHRAASEGAGKPTTGASVTTLDELVAGSGAERIVLIKLDVDGNEPQVLAGGKECLARHRPAIALELAPTTAAGGLAGVGELLDQLARAGYRTVTHRRRTFPIGAEEAILRRIPRGGSINVLLR